VTAQPPPDPHATAGPAWLAGRTALVTGGGLGGPDGSGGWAVSLLFARHGARVAVLDRDEAAAKTTVDAIQEAGGEAVAVTADVTADGDCARAVAEALERFGTLDTLVNNVAAGDRVLLFDPDLDAARWDELLRVNLTSVWLMTRHALPALRRSTGRGAVVNISSVATTLGAPMPYSVAKAGVENLTTGAAKLLGPDGIRVNCVQIGAIWSAMAARTLTPEQRDARRRGVALQTEGTVWDPAYAALFLASDRARWVSGHVLTVDGGGPRSPFTGSGPERSRDTAAADLPPDRPLDGGSTA
jgi:NAD(P)-dependent dehydrogenase (short-subunit alcohol dehydrogenase family)